jgi:ADP-L-glycero-D-manno-heptose 6-epimerase
MFIVTGGAGFIGSAFIAKLNSEGIKDILVVDDLASSPRWKNLVRKSFRDYVQKDRFLEMVRSNTLPASVEGILHLGACSSTTERNVEYLLQNNYEYTKALAEYSIHHGIRFVYASSAATYGDGALGYDDDETHLSELAPLNAYGYSKHLFDLWARKQGLFSHVAGLKFFNVYGPNEYYKEDMASVVWKAFNKIRESGSFSLFKSYRPDYKDGEQKRDFVYVKDCCDVMWWLLNNRIANGLFNVGSGKARSWNDLVGSVFGSLKRAPHIEYIEMPLHLRDQYQYFTEAPISKLRNAGFTKPFHTLEEGIDDYVSRHLLKSDPHW